VRPHLTIFDRFAFKSSGLTFSW